MSGEDQLYPNTRGAVHRRPLVCLVLFIAPTLSKIPGAAWRGRTGLVPDKVGARMTGGVRIAREPVRVTGSAGGDQRVQAEHEPLGHQELEGGKGDS